MSQVEDARDCAKPAEPTVKVDEAAPIEETLSTPPNEANGLDGKVSRKREREVSLEPSTPQATTTELDSAHAEHRERRKPAKKNRLSGGALDSTAEEDDATEDVDVTGSPPHETKIREISQGVEEINWQNGKKDGESVDADQVMQTESLDRKEDGAGEETTPTRDTVSEAATGADPQPEFQVEKPPIVSEPPSDVPASVPVAEEKPPDSSNGEKAAFPAINAQSDEEVSTEAPQRDSDSDQEKGLKRKLGDRTVSQRLVPGEPSTNSSVSVATKRPRDDPDADPNEREKKRPTPPPEEDEKPAETPAKPVEPKPKPASSFGGFMAYASTTSPFAAVNGPNIFKSASPSPWATPSAGPSSRATPAVPASPSPSPFASAGSTGGIADTPLAHKRTGFEAFASSSSPFASAAKRPKSPSLGTPAAFGRSKSPQRYTAAQRGISAFSAYTGGSAQGFAAPKPKRVAGHPFRVSPFGTSRTLPRPSDDEEKEESDEQDESRTSFGARLRAAQDKEEEETSDEEKRMELREKEVVTGEEEDETVYQVRGKLFTLSEQHQWTERGTGMLRLNVRREDGRGARLLMRKEAVYTLLLNATLFKGMRCFLAQDPRYIRFSVFENSTTTHYNLRVANAKIAEELLDEINARIPTE